MAKTQESAIAAEATETTETAPVSGDDLVEVYLFKDNGKYKSDLFVAVNGESCVIQRGKPVKVKRKFAEVIEAGRVQDARTAELMDTRTGEYAQELSGLGL